MPTLNRQLRQHLERNIIAARKVAEAGAAQALGNLAVAQAKPWASMSPEQQALRNRLRAHARQLGDRRNANDGTQEVTRLARECAYEHWHRMLFARFLAENELLIEPVSGIAISLRDCQELARERNVEWMELASSYAVRMLPQVFRAGDPVLKVALAIETRRKLEGILDTLPSENFVADDSLGWTYQFWQTERKDEVNASGVKIGSEEIGPVTQLFTEDYMVEFLLHNTIGAWWAGKRGPVNAASEEEARRKVSLPENDGLPAIEWTYLRFIRDEVNGCWRPAAGGFESWPQACRDIRFLDPCMGSGHFPVSALPILARLRMEEERLASSEAIAATLRENIFGLEIDPRCTQIGAFNLALHAWKLGGYQPLPPLNVACSGLAPHMAEKDWVGLAGDNDRLKRGMARLYALFKDAPILGSLINPSDVSGDLVEADPHELRPLLEMALVQEAKDDTSYEVAVTARGLAKAAEILAGQFTIIATNVPYLGRGKQNDVLKDHCEHFHGDAKADLATCFVERSLRFCAPGGTAALVTPQNWMFMGSYEKFRSTLLAAKRWDWILRLGEHAFDSPAAAGAFVALVALTNSVASSDHRIMAGQAADDATPEAKAASARTTSFVSLDQYLQLKNPDARISLVVHGKTPRLSDVCSSFLGLGTGDYARHGRCYWEFAKLPIGWTFQQGSVESPRLWGGREHAVAWDFDTERVRGLSEEEREQIHNQDQSGQQAWGKRGVAVGLMRDLKPTLYTGERYDKAVAALIPKSPDLLPAIWALCSSRDFHDLVRELDQNIIVANGTLTKIPFDLSRWQKVALEKYPTGLPLPSSSDPTQWLFNGHPRGSDCPLHVAVARLLGYQWPRQTGSSFPDCPTLGSDGLEKFADDDGIVCIPALRRESGAAERLAVVLQEAFDREWTASKHSALLAETGYADSTLHDWLADKFFEDHCKLFSNRPFIWQIWDGLQGGFGALLNYHMIAAPNGKGRKLLEKLSHSYLGDWLSRQRAEQKAGAEGADARVAAAVHLKSQLDAIIAGDPPFDLFVRWKPLHEQAIGWEPDINMGVRMNIRPFITAKTLNGKSILRKAPNIKWTKDRGTDPERPRADFPWYWNWDQRTVDFKGDRAFDGTRWNDLHYTRDCKLIARERHEKAVGHK